MSGLSLHWHDPLTPAPPAGWDEFATEQQLWPVWDWSIIHTVATEARVATLAATIRDGSTAVGLVTARFPGLRPGRRRTPLAGVVDVDCLASASAPGIALTGADPQLRAEAVAALRDGLRREFGRRMRAVMFRQLDSDWLPTVLHRPAIVREGSPIAVFRNRFRDFDGYLSSLRRQRRRTLRSLIHTIDTDPQLIVRFTGHGDRIGPLDLDRARQLQAQVVDRNHRRWWLRKRTPSLPVLQAQLSHPRALLATYHHRDELVAYALVLDHPRQPLAHGWGALAPAEGGPKGTYFHINAMLIRWCIETGREAVTFGQGGAEEKRRLGYDLTRQWAVLVP